MLKRMTRPTSKHSLRTTFEVRQAQGSQSVFAATVVHRQLISSSRVVGGGSGGQRLRIEQVVDGHRRRHDMSNKTTAKSPQRRAKRQLRLHAFVARRKRIAFSPDQRQRSFVSTRL